uniref:Uncharacterized protein n=1 Tax=Rhizophora mucronata TaxID=61149 RepID=A0A2P2J2H9_RHIMU
MSIALKCYYWRWQVMLANNCLLCHCYRISNNNSYITISKFQIRATTLILILLIIMSCTIN